MEQPKHTRKLPGFYIAVCCCVAAIGAAGFFARRDNDKPVDLAVVADNTERTDTNEYIAAAEPASTPDNRMPVITEPDEVQSEDVPAVPDYAADNPDMIPASVTVYAEDSGLLLDPLPSKTVLHGFFGDRPEYNEVYADWRTHDGIDIAAENGGNVSAVSDGTVLEVDTCSYGKYVKIDHAEGIIAIYAQLNDIYVAEGDNVSAGEVIATIGDSMGENVREPHLHFEIVKDGKCVNPEEY